MGFRNPITTLSAAQITPGALGPGVHLPADQIDSGAVAPGVVWTAGTLGAARVELSGAGMRRYKPDGVTVDMDLTGPDAVFSGKVIAAEIIGGAISTGGVGVFTQIELGGSAPEAITFLSGNPAEWTPGQIEVGSGGDRGFLHLEAPDTNPAGSGGGPHGEITLRSASSVLGGAAAAVELDGDLYVNGVPYAHRSSSHLVFSPAGNLDTPAAGTATWMTLGNITVPAWATSADVVYAINGLYEITAAVNVSVVMKIGTVAGAVSKRILTPGYVAGTRTNLPIMDTFTGLTGGVKSVTLSAAWVAGTGKDRVDASSYVTALFAWRP